MGRPERLLRARQQGGPPHDVHGTSATDGPDNGEPVVTVSDADPVPPPIDITPAPHRTRGADRGDGGWLNAALDRDDEPTDVDVQHDVRPRRTWAPRARRIALGVARAVGLAGAATVGVAAMRIVEQKDATLTPPPAVAGLRLDDSPEARATAENLRTALAAGIDLDKTVAVVYADPASEDRDVFLFGGTALLFSPGRELDDVLELLVDQGTTATGMRTVTAGDLGGVMKCGAVAVPEGGMSACGWADHGSVAVAMFPNRDVAEAAALMRRLRSATQSRS